MKKSSFLFLLVFAFGSFCVNAQNTGVNEGEWRSKSINFGYVSSSFKVDDVKASSNFGATFNVTKTYFLHKPISNILRFGIDATWIDLNYSKYKFETPPMFSTFDSEDESYQNGSGHQLEIAMRVGPSITVEPVSGLAVRAYFQYAPTFACLFEKADVNDGYYYDDEDESETVLWGNYASMFVAGAQVSYKIIGAGIEGKFGKPKYKQLTDAVDDAESVKTSLSSFRVFLSLRF